MNALRQRTLRITLAVIVAPWATVVAVAVNLVVAGFILGQEGWEIASNYGAFAFYGMIVAYPATVLLGLPGHLLLSKLGFGSVWMHALLGAALALMIGSYYLNIFEIEEQSALIIWASLLVLPGASVAAAFRAIAGQPQDDIE